MNTDFTCNQIVPLLVADFGKLWQCKPRGDTIEIITPFSTASQRFISVFVTKRNQDIVVSDGGWLDDESDTYGLLQTKEEAECDYYIDHFSSVFGVASKVKSDGQRIFFKKCGKLDLLSSAVYDISNFILSVSNSGPIPSEQTEDTERKETFRKQANDFLSGTFHDNVKFLRPIDGLETVKFSAVINPTPSSLALVVYVTGSTHYYFSGDMRRAIVNFELANKSKSAPYIKSRIALLDNTALGYAPQRNVELIDLLGTHKGRAVNWTEKDNLISMCQ